jgi:predicted alpha/beta-hydrolase family hydrolase
MPAGQQALTIPVRGHGGVSAVLHRPKPFERGVTPGLLLAHGAGSDMDAPFLLAVAESLALAGILVLRFNFPYTDAGRRAPDRADVLLATLRAAADCLRSGTSWTPGRVYLGGKSMGGRIASHLAALDYPCDGLVFLSYPLHPAGGPEPGGPERSESRLQKGEGRFHKGQRERAGERAAHLPRIAAPMLFIQGSRDALCDLALLRPPIEPLGRRVRLHVIEEGDHSFEVPKRLNRRREEVWDEVVAQVRSFILGGVPRDDARPATGASKRGADH